MAGKFIQTLAVLAAVQFVALHAAAATVTYSDEASFLADAGSLAFDSFEDLTPTGTPLAAISRTGYSVSDTGTGQFQDDLRICPAGFCASFSAPTDGSVFLHTSGQVTYTFDAPVNAVSFTASAFTVFPFLTLVTDAGDSEFITVPDFGINGVNFIGLINNDSTFNALTVTYGRDDDSVAIDEVRFGTASATAIPVPAPLTILGVGLLGLAALRRRAAH